MVQAWGLFLLFFGEPLIEQRRNRFPSCTGGPQWLGVACLTCFSHYPFKQKQVYLINIHTIIITTVYFVLKKQILRYSVFKRKAFKEVFMMCFLPSICKASLFHRPSREECHYPAHLCTRSTRISP